MGQEKQKVSDSSPSASSSSSENNKSCTLATCSMCAYSNNSTIKSHSTTTNSNTTNTNSLNSLNPSSECLFKRKRRKSPSIFYNSKSSLHFLITTSSLLLLLVSLNFTSCFETPDAEEEQDHNFNDYNSYYSSSSSSPFVAQSLGGSTVSAVPPGTYFINGLANTIRAINSTILQVKSAKEPFQLHFRTACPFGNLIYDNTFSLGLNLNGNLTYSTEKELASSPTSLEDISESTYDQVSDGKWHTLTFNGSNVSWNNNKLVDLSGSKKFENIKFFDGFVGCIKLTTINGDAILSGEDYYNSNHGNLPEDTISILEYFQFDMTQPYPGCSDLSLDLKEIQHCPNPDEFILCGKCQNNAKCEEEEQEIANFCFCGDNTHAGKYCEVLLPIVETNDASSPIGNNNSEDIFLGANSNLVASSTNSTVQPLPTGRISGRSENFTTPPPLSPVSSTTSTSLHPTLDNRITNSTTFNCPCLHGGACLSTSLEVLNSGGKICSCEGTGYYGERCEIENTFCRSSPCVHGICQPKGDTYQCYCLPGFAGSNCDINFNECLSNPCGTNGVCVDDVNTYRCKCNPGYIGINCETEIDECEVGPCQNGGACHDAVANYTCSCIPGFEGHSCEINIDECQDQPCRNGGICIDEINKFSCNCTDTGYQGFYCDREINECDEKPCKNNATCVDQLKAYQCNCHAGFTGENCEADIKECELLPCKNNATCLERSNISLYNSPPSSGLPQIFFGSFSYNNASGYECICQPGFEGENCEEDIDECAPRPCGANGKCQDGPNSFTCDCHEGYTGSLCETEINECDQNPCVRGECVDKVADFQCICPEGYGSKDCSVVLIGCNDVVCEHNGVCTPTYINSTHGKKCNCAPGWAGELCEDSTTLSFGGSKGGYAELISNDENYRSRYAMSFRFRTTLTDVLIAVGQGSTYFMLTLSGGKLNLQSSLLNSLKGISSGNNVSNADWHRAWVSINESHIALGVNQEQTIHPIQTEPEQPVETGFNTTVLGGATPGLSLTNLPSFVGCIQDIQINDKKIVPAERGTNLRFDPALVKVGDCNRTEQCPTNGPCLNGGTCTDLWTKFECKCPRPFLGEKCEYEYTAATFGHENTTFSYVEVHIQNEIGKKFDKSFEISMFVRTREPRGTIFLLTDDRKENALFLEAYVEDDGQLGVLAKLDEGKEETYKVGGLAINDGEPHLISFQKEKGLVKINVNGTEHFRKSLPLKPTQIFNPSVMYIGGVPTPIELEPSSSTTTAIPESSSMAEIPAVTLDPVEFTSSSTSGPVVSHSRTTRAVATYRMEPFKGVIQDVRVNLSTDGGSSLSQHLARYVVEFFPLSQVNKSFLMGEPLGTVVHKGQVFRGVVSDNTCKVNPCLNNGQCVITWNDFKCNCTPEYDGKTCNHLLPCAIVKCPIGSTCKNLYSGNGFECQSEAAFDGKGTVSPHYHLKTRDDLENLTFNNISFRYRSQRGGSIIYIADQNGSSLKISLEYDELSASSTQTEPPNSSYISVYINGYRSAEKINRALNGEWHFVELSFDPENRNFILKFDGTERKTPVSGTHVPTNFLKRIITSQLPEIIVGSYVQNGKSSSYQHLDHSTDSSNDVTVHSENLHDDYYRGCLADVSIGKYRLPFVSPTQLLEINSGNHSLIDETAPTAFYIDESHDARVQIGCVLCYNNECENGGHCEDPKEKYECSCREGYAGKLCEVNIDECESGNHCTHESVCIDQVANYTCSCKPGYTGWLCDSEIDECDPNPCQSIDSLATCVDGIGYYECTCSGDFIGTNCEKRKLSKCTDKPCENGARCREVPLKSDGTYFNCDCPLGYKGPTCGQEINYCENVNCYNHGTCHNKKAGAECLCALGWTGPRCEINIDDCESSPCKNNGTCNDGLNRFMCNCSGTGFKGLTCEEDIDECSDYVYFNQCPLNSTCLNLPGTFDCHCNAGLCGINCDMEDPCDAHFCYNGGECLPDCEPGYEPIPKCLCRPPYTGTNCTEKLVGAEPFSPRVNVVLIVIPVITAFLIAAIIAIVILVRMARKKRATRGVYSPSQQEYCNPRVELDNVMKPPPEERLI